VKRGAGPRSDLRRQLIGILASDAASHQRTANNQRMIGVLFSLSFSELNF
jgi:hypothetical protein